MRMVRLACFRPKCARNFDALSAREPCVLDFRRDSNCADKCACIVTISQPTPT
jgi:hypothetical protein